MLNDHSFPCVFCRAFPFSGGMHARTTGQVCVRERSPLILKGGESRVVSIATSCVFRNSTSRSTSRGVAIRGMPVKDTARRADANWRLRGPTPSLASEALADPDRREPFRCARIFAGSDSKLVVPERLMPALASDCPAFYTPNGWDAFTNKRPRTPKRISRGRPAQTPRTAPRRRAPLRA